MTFKHGHLTNIKHGHCVNGQTSSEYHSWDAMIQRCENPNTTHYHYYGGRGITVSAEFHDFQVWYDHIGPRPGPDYT